jgi:predicted transcriptional regulator
MREKDKRFNVRVDEPWIDRLQRAAGVLDRPASQIVRDAVNEKLERLGRRNPRLAAALDESRAA